jgi:hypothetical protein
MRSAEGLVVLKRFLLIFSDLIFDSKVDPGTTVIVGYWLPAIRAVIEMNRNNPAKATELLHAAVPTS